MKKTKTDIASKIEKLVSALGEASAKLADVQVALINAIGECPSLAPLISGEPPRGDVRMDRMETCIAEFLESQNKQLPEKEIRESMEGNTRDKSIGLRNLVKKGWVERSGKGRRGDPYLYKLVDNPSLQYGLAYSHKL